MGEVVDEHERFGHPIVSAAKALRAHLVFGHQLTRAVDLRIKRYDLVCDCLHVLLGPKFFGPQLALE